MSEAASNMEAMRATIAALREAGKLRPQHEALETMALSLADQVDGPATAALWREYREVVERLEGLAADEDTDQTATFVAGLPGTVRDE